MSYVYIAVPAGWSYEKAQDNSNAFDCLINNENKDLIIDMQSLIKESLRSRKPRNSEKKEFNDKDTHNVGVTIY